jgi:hypothetical protein
LGTVSPFLGYVTIRLKTYNISSLIKTFRRQPEKYCIHNIKYVIMPEVGFMIRTQIQLTEEQVKGIYDRCFS